MSRIVRVRETALRRTIDCDQRVLVKREMEKLGMKVNRREAEEFIRREEQKEA